MWQDVDPDNMSYEVRIFVLLASVLEIRQCTVSVETVIIVDVNC